ncbi:uncharacterized protein [Physcomitrium patens]|uniref:Bifunctional inhibitor/plant lipid transfer protein/seed storage helical domain-containing protein n=1 Tax=Physcomitrium patens TaxID=3218 RepID=A0A2K1L010_PHYPA|nr:uncharacterized protein LOC112274347 [Physcomitrium patens]PNR59359.1 hypothetical protein PHYPA_002150 [Physcomitrium patens]|eukprot:XP_024359541.1 uncharacterized protein LOC112274347 [Physcomitrella patens]
MATSQLRWIQALMVMTFLFTAQMAGSSRVRLDGAGLEHHGRSLKQTCWPGIRANCHSNTQVECEVGGVAGCSCLAMEACLPEVSGCFIVVNGISTKSCGF